MSRFFSRRRSPVAALAERRDRCKAEPQDRVRLSAHAEADVADGFAAEALFQFSEDLRLGDLFELVVQCGLENPDVQHALAQRYRRGGRGDEFADDL
jgi:hypothetical protein